MHSITEKRFLAVPPQLFTVNGTADGVVTLGDASLFKVKQVVLLNGTSLPTIELEVKRVINAISLAVGPVGGSIDDRTDISAYTVALSSNIKAIEQLRSKVPEQSVERFTYEEEPTIARRVVLVDKLGDKIDADNPLPVDATINVDNLQIDTRRLTDEDNDPDPGDIHDAIRIGDGVEELLINPDGSINVKEVDASNPTIYNLSAPLANTEYSQVLPIGTKRILARTRDGNTVTRFAYTSGATFTTYITIGMGVVYTENDLSISSPLTFYFQTNKANQILELLVWT